MPWDEWTGKKGIFSDETNQIFTQCDWYNNWKTTTTHDTYTLSYHWIFVGVVFVSVVGELA